MPDGYSPLDGGGIQRTELHCHNCSKQFIAELDLDIDGKYVIECPHCGHEHCRKIEKGKVTNSRWDGRNDSDITRVGKRSVWKSTVIAAKTSTVAAHIRERWLNRDDYNGR